MYNNTVFNKWSPQNILEKFGKISKNFAADLLSYLHCLIKNAKLNPTLKLNKSFVTIVLNKYWNLILANILKL